ncbi:MAG: GTP-binding protein [Lachnospiraceae bacterium]|nr:GTP-binding protein [Lachnospiraceae bacterium]
MTKIDIMSGFLGAGKTTLIQKLLKEALTDEKVVLIENEFGEIGIDGGFLKDSGIEIREMNSGCICCSLVGDFATSLKEVLDTYAPDRIIIEPSGVGKLSDVENAVLGVDTDAEAALNSKTVVVDAAKCKVYMKNFGEFFLNQVESAGTIVLSHTGSLSDEKVQQVTAMLREHNANATIVTTPWDQISGQDILSTMEKDTDLQADLLAELRAKRLQQLAEEGDEEEECCCHHHHHYDEDDHEHHHHEDEEDEHEHHHHHEDDEDEHEHHHHHEDDEDEHEHHHDDEEHEHHHDHEHHHHHHHHGDGECCDDHDADEIFVSWGMETPAKYTKAEIEAILEALDDQETYGLVLRAKGMVASPDGTWVYFDYVPEEENVREGKPDVTGKFCVIGSELKEDNLAKLFARR